MKDYRELTIKVLMKSGSTRLEAVNHMNNGSCIYEMYEKPDFIENAENCGFDREDAEEMWNKMPSYYVDGIEYKLEVVL